MIRSLLSAVVLACVLILAPTGESQKEISSAHATEPVMNVLSDLMIATAQAHPCVVVMASNDSSAVPLPRPKPDFVKSKVKKKFAVAPTKQKKKNHHWHHGSHHHHSHHAPQNNLSAHGPSPLTSSPGCG